MSPLPRFDIMRSRPSAWKAWVVSAVPKVDALLRAAHVQVDRRVSGRGDFIPVADEPLHHFCYE
eukprot:13902594-Alexandrium_andersonii.AAC.1